MKKILSFIFLISLINWSSAFANSDESISDEFYEADTDFDIEAIEANIRPPVVPIHPPVGHPIIFPCQNGADLIVSQLLNPEWDNTNRQSVISAVIKNKGGRAITQSFVVRFQDGSQVRNLTVSGLSAGASKTVTFRLPYWIYNPDASYRITADVNNQVQECIESNNFKDFAGIG